MSTLTARVIFRHLPLSSSSLAAVKNLDRYDLTVFTSKNARRFFLRELRKRGIAAPQHTVTVGPRKDLLKLPLKGKRILFPRSALAPRDIVQSMRSRGATVRVVPLYTAVGKPLTAKERLSLRGGKIKNVYFRSPSGVRGLLRQMRGEQKRRVRALPARCIGETTAAAARAAGFKKVSIAGIL
jgi:uroporphyrinogen-III synthase